MEKKSSFTKEELLAVAEGEIYGAENGKFPLPPMLMVDRILHISEDGGAFNRGSILGEMDITSDLWFFSCHFKGDPVMPGCLGLDALWQLTGFFLTWLGGEGKGRALGCGEVKFKGQIRPHHDKIIYKLDIRRVIRKPVFMALANATVEVEDKTIYIAKKLQVGLFKDLVYPPPEGVLEPF
ncbi:MAG: bifunctional 3-hydroxydecanoyl-ACP dehydratase/trans-2-decenoyl-ACP isomerase [Fidelibacterota bacterium]